MEKWDYSNAEVVQAEEAVFDFRRVLDQILDHLPYIVVSLILALILAFLVNRYSTRVYEVGTTILINAPKESNSISELLYGEEIFGRSSILLEDEAQLFKSGTLVEKTLRELDMDVTYHFDGPVGDIELYKNSPIHMFVPDTTFNAPYGIVLECNIIDEKRFQLQFQSQSLPKRLKNLLTRESSIEDNFKDNVYHFGQQINVDGFVFRMEYNPTLNLPQYNNLVLVKINNYSSITKRYIGKIKAAPHSADSYLMHLTMQISNTEKGTDFLEELVANFIESELLLKNTIATNTIEFINSQILLMSDSLNIVEDRLETFKKSNSNLTLSDQGSNYLQIGQEFELQRNQVQLKNRYLSDLESSISTDDVSDIYIPSSVGIDDPNLNKNIQELVDLQMQLKSIDPDRNSSNPIVRNYQQRIDILKRGVGENIRSIKSSNSIALNNINSQLGRVNSTLRTLPTAERQFINIQRNYNLSEELYLFLMQKKAEAGIAKASNTVDFRIVNDADTKGKGPIKPSPMLNYILALLLGGAVPIGFIFLKDALNNKINSKEQLLGLSAIPYLGMVARSSAKIKLIDNKNVRSE
ncbi:MAG: GumC family protein, partial [Cyclobacteriaceae bacterium]